MTTNRGTYGKELASDLLADLNQPLAVDRSSTQQNPLTPVDLVDPVEPAATREFRSRGPAVEVFLRIGPFEWLKPAVSIGWRSTTIRFGLLCVELRIASG